MRRTVLASLFCTALLGAALLGPWTLPAMKSGWARLRSVGRHDPVLVIVVGDSGTVARLRTAIAPDRIVATSDDAFAVREDRVVAASLEAAGPILTAAGLGRRRVEIWSASAVRGPAPVPRAAHPTGLPPGLASKPTLTLGEALMLLDQDMR